MWNYSEKLKDHFYNPRNVGIIENPDGWEKWVISVRRCPKADDQTG
jgi:NifU-like N terminal domain.